MGHKHGKKLLRSREGLQIVIDDKAGRFIIETPAGQKFLLQNAPGRIEINDEFGSSVTLGAGEISVKASAKVTINAAVVEVNAAMVNVNAGMSKFSGVVHCDTLISNRVVSPGAGNIW
jgi:S-adenosylmethionine synthetase